MSKKSKKILFKKTETLAEFLARGKTITKLPEQPRKPQIDTLRQNPNGPAVIMSLEDAEIYYGEPSKNKKAKKPKSSSLSIDINALPPALRQKFISKLKEEDNVEEYQEELEELEETIESDDSDVGESDDELDS